MNNEMNIDVKADIEEFCDTNDDQANNDGMRWIIYLFFYSFYTVQI